MAWGLGRGGVSVGVVARLGKVSLVGGFNLPKSVAWIVTSIVMVGCMRHSAFYCNYKL